MSICNGRNTKHRMEHLVRIVKRSVQRRLQLPRPGGHDKHMAYVIYHVCRITSLLDLSVLYI